jgi:hypothetical protein
MLGKIFMTMVPLSKSTMLDGNGFMGSDGWMPGDYGALESVYTLDGMKSPDGTLFDPPCGEEGPGTKY